MIDKNGKVIQSLERRREEIHSELASIDTTSIRPIRNLVLDMYAFLEMFETDTFRLSALSKTNRDRLQAYENKVRELRDELTKLPSSVIHIHDMSTNIKQ